MDFSFAQQPDVSAGQKTYKEVGVARFAPVLGEDQLRPFLESFTGVPDWVMAYIVGDDERSLSAEAVGAMSPDERQALSNEINKNAGKQPGYVHQRVPVDKIAEHRTGAPHPMFDMRDFIRSDAVGTLVKDVTGRDDITNVTVDIYTYGPNQFLNHNIGSAGDPKRRIGYELTLSANWRPDFGGYLAFYDALGNHAPGLGPAYNCLTLWDASKGYAITPIAPYCPFMRFSVGGWFIAD